MLTWLYVPGDRPDRFATAVAAGADAVIIDLEDAVAHARKAYARNAVAEFLSERHGVPVSVRVGADVDADLDAIAGRVGLAGVRIPKATVDTVRHIAGRIDAPLECLIESAAAVEAAYEIATAHPAVASIGLGEADLAADLGVTDERGLAWPRGRVVVAAHAAGLPAPAISVYPDVADLAGLAASCARGRRLGLFGRAAIHPRQLPVIVEAFRPSASDVERARELLAAVAAAAARDSGVTVLPDGRFADRAMLAAAERTVAMARRHGVA